MVQYTTGRTSELRIILAKARAKADGSGETSTEKDDKLRKKTMQNNNRLNSDSGNDDDDDDDVKEMKVVKSNKKIETKPPKIQDYVQSKPSPPPMIKSSPKKSNNRSHTVPLKSASDGSDNFYFKSNGNSNSKYNAPSDDDESDNDDQMDGRSTLSRMIKQKQRQMLRK